MTVHLLFTGGTISMRPDKNAGGNVPAFKGEELVKRVDGLAKVAPIRVEDWGLFPAAHLDLGRLWSLRERVREILAGPDAPTGIVITHGTDTMEETAYLLARTLPRGRPIVLTGAMRNADHLAWDGADNLRDAVRVAASPEAQGRGAMIAFAGTILDGLDALKVDTDALEAFEPAHGQPLGVVQLGRVTFTADPPPPRFAAQPTGLTARILMATMTPGDDGAVLDAALGQYHGAVVTAFGAGNVPPGAAAAIGRWLEAGFPVVIVSRCHRGQVSASYAFEGGAAQLVEAGATLAGPRTPAQAWMEMTIALSAGRPYGK
ncbi:MAG TPA: asparaginase [Gemmatimonadales bacterium]|nr:asparaginase [Gemmatimonadales bacterium]